MFAKLFSRITESSLMEAPIPVRYTFVMLLAIADPQGYVIGTDVAIARRLNMPLDEFVACIHLLGLSDEDSNSKEQDGRRIVPSDGERGYYIVNYVRYKGLRTEDERREYMRNYMRERRGKQPVNTGKLPLAAVKQAEAEAEAEAEKPVHTPMAQGQKGPTLPEVIAFADMRGVKKELAQTFWHHYESIGWIDPFNRPIQSWTSKLMAWNAKEAGRVAEKNASANGKGFWESMKRLELVEKEIVRLENLAGRDAMGTLMLTDKLRGQLTPLRNQRSELKAMLGLRYTDEKSKQAAAQP